MNLSDREMLRQLGAGRSIADVCQAAGCSRSQFDRWWKACLADRVPDAKGDIAAPVKSAVTIQRDRRGIPHIRAENDEDLFLAFGYAMAQDRLFQMDYLRRKGAGRLAEISGPEALPSDLMARTVGLPHIAASEWEQLPRETQALLTAFTAGVNLVIAQSKERRPIEFDLLDYQPAPWSEVDCLTIENEFRWYLTGRFPVIVIPELVKRALSDPDQLREFFCGEALEETLLPPDGYPAAAAPLAKEPLGPPIGSFDDGTGSNNWVIGGHLTASGKPLVASDPHIAMEAVSCWYQAHLQGGSFHVAGMTYVGMPAIMFGRTERVAWGITNNICSLRDLYQEQTDSEHPGCFLFDGRWEPWRERTESIVVKGQETVTETIRSSRNGPIVDAVLPSPAESTGPVALKWLGMYAGGWLTALHGMNRSSNVDEFNEALRPWHVPTFSLVFADTDGHIGLKVSGRIPIRHVPEIGYRPGHDPAHQWDGLIPFEAMPGVIDPQQGYVATANNPLASGDFPYPLSCTSPAGYRARRIRELIEAARHSHDGASSQTAATNLDRCGSMQFDVLSLRAVHAVPRLGAILARNPPTTARSRQALDAVISWDGQVLPQAVGPSIFNVFFTHWTRMVLAEKFDAAAHALLAMGAEGFAARLLEEDRQGWFAKGQRDRQVRTAFEHAVEDLTQRLGGDVTQWQWGRLHRMKLPHVLSSRGALGTLFDDPDVGVRGDMQTVCNTGSGADWSAATGAGFRMIADLADGQTLMTIDAPSQSGHPGSPHYQDQLAGWLAGEYQDLPLSGQAADTDKQLTLKPDG